MLMKTAVSLLFIGLSCCGSSLAAIGKTGSLGRGVNKPGHGKSGTGRGSTGNVVPGGDPGFENSPGGGALFPAGQDTIDIDANEGNIAGSSGDQWDDDEGSGPDTESSGAGSVSLTPCLDMKRALEERRVQAHYEPLCSSDGYYMSRQCDRQKQCWCVTKEGTKTTTKSPENDIPQEDCDRALGQQNNVETPMGNKPGDLDPATKEGHPDIGYGSNGDHNGEHKEEGDMRNNIPNMGNTDMNPDVKQTNGGPNGVGERKSGKEPVQKDTSLLMGHPGILAGIIGGAVVGLLCAVLLVMFIVYRMRKKDEGSYALDEPRKSPTLHGYRPANQKEYYA